MLFDSNFANELLKKIHFKFAFCKMQKCNTLNSKNKNKLNNVMHYENSNLAMLHIRQYEFQCNWALYSEICIV